MKVTITKAINGFVVTTAVNPYDDDYVGGRGRQQQAKTLIAKDEGELAHVVAELFGAKKDSKAKGANKPVKKI